MPSLLHVGREWERSEEMREQVRQRRQLLLWDDPSTRKINIANAALNFISLKPLAQRLRGENGDVGMHSVPDIKRQFLDSMTWEFFMSNKCLFNLVYSCFFGSNE